MIEQEVLFGHGIVGDIDVSSFGDSEREVALLLRRVYLKSDSRGGDIVSGELIEMST